MRRMWGHARMDMYSKVKDVALYVGIHAFLIPILSFKLQFE